MLTRFLFFGFCLAGLAGPALAQIVITSARPDRVAVTLYRNPERPASQAPDPEWLGGFALVTETRRVTLPAGESELRFEGVAGGIVPQSAIVSGFPNGTVERNRDAYLLSPSTLLDRSLGQRVMIRRTSRATGRVTRTEAVIRSGAGGAVVLQTREGVEALRCTGLPEMLAYPSLPTGLSARPTLSVRTRASRRITATVTLSYLASGFDWQATYVATVSPDYTHVDLLAWLSLSSNDETSFVQADVQAVAGRLNREEVAEQPREGGPLQLQCWPAATTSDIPLEEWQRMAMGRGRNLLERSSGDIVVTGSRIPAPPNLTSVLPITTLTADQEDLGDVKLYRIPEAVTLAARSQKQVAFLNVERIPIRNVHRQTFDERSAFETEPAEPYAVLLVRNRRGEALAAPLPAGSMLVVVPGPDRPFLLGEASIRDHSLGEDLVVAYSRAPGVLGRLRLLSRENNVARFMVTVSNDQAEPIAFEGELDFRIARANARLGSRNGRPLWTVTVPANGRAVLCFSTALTDDDELPEQPAGPDPACPAEAD